MSLCPVLTYFSVIFFLFRAMTNSIKLLLFSRFTIQKLSGFCTYAITRQRKTFIFVNYISYICNQYDKIDKYLFIPKAHKKLHYKQDKANIQHRNINGHLYIWSLINKHMKVIQHFCVMKFCYFFNFGFLIVCIKVLVVEGNYFILNFP